GRCRSTSRNSCLKLGIGPSPPNGVALSTARTLSTLTHTPAELRISVHMFSCFRVSDIPTSCHRTAHAATRISIFLQLRRFACTSVLPDAAASRFCLGGRAVQALVAARGKGSDV